MSTQPTPKRHPLDGVDEWESYDQHIAERNKLISAQREAQDGFIKTIIQLSSAIVLAVPGLLSLSNGQFRVPSNLLIFGLALLGLALLAALTEQYVSGLAYSKQINKTDEYYLKKIDSATLPAYALFLHATMLFAFVFFLSGIAILSCALVFGPWS